MNDTQDDLILRQRQVQQRQILAMMGIEQWVQPSSPTISMANIPAPTVQQPVEDQQPISELDVEHASFEPKAPMQDTPTIIGDYEHTVPIDTDISDGHKSTIDTAESSTIKAPVAPDNQVVTQTVAQQWVEPLVETVTSSISDVALTAPDNTVKNNNNNSLNKVAPFDLQGGRYGNWVLLIDIQALNNDSQKLWQNITQALSLSCETSSFPICAGMDTTELANASFAGYIFKIGRSEEVLIAALTALPDGIEHPNLTSVPTLNEMLTDSHLKKQFWHQLSKQD
ncbi:hypothetical protein [Psychrobacter sp. CAL346-MNA-CIBAN-0220]|uniref:hypothetical protein n=1 Tax=Psychrobacter sp. CAL346-MNA-CIBAN-0220 TaxID=3140457 RepID=UPI00332FF06B